MIPSVVASESGTAQTGRTCLPGVAGPRCGRRRVSVTIWKNRPETVRAGCAKAQSPLGASQVARCTRNSVRICPDNRIRLNTPWQPIVNKYREGKVKRTPARGVKEYLQPNAYNESE